MIQSKHLSSLQSKISKITSTFIFSILIGSQFASLETLSAPLESNIDRIIYSGGPSAGPGTPNGPIRWRPIAARPPRRRPVPRQRPARDDWNDSEAKALIDEITDDLDCSEIDVAITRLSQYIAETREEIRNEPRPDFQKPKYQGGERRRHNPRQQHPGRMVRGRKLPPKFQKPRRDLTDGERWAIHHRAPAFWQYFWLRVQDTYNECKVSCFQDGEAVGQISATAYCGASIGVGGMESPGFVVQPPLPFCDKAVHRGCLKGYRETASTYEGCSAYTEGDYKDVYFDFMAQDCLVEPEEVETESEEAISSVIQ